MTKSRYQSDSAGLNSSRVKEQKRKEQLLGMIDSQSDVVFHDVYENIHRKIQEQQQYPLNIASTN